MMGWGDTDTRSDDARAVREAGEWVSHATAFIVGLVVGAALMLAAIAWVMR